MKYALIAALLGSAGIAATTQTTTLFDRTDANGNRVVIIDAGTSPSLTPKVLTGEMRIPGMNKSESDAMLNNRAYVPSDRMKALMDKMDGAVIR